MGSHDRDDFRPLKVPVWSQVFRENRDQIQQSVLDILLLIVSTAPHCDDEREPTKSIAPGDRSLAASGRAPVLPPAHICLRSHNVDALCGNSATDA